MTTPPLDDLDPVIHAPKRLAAMAMLANATSCDYGFIREALAISESDLSKQMAALVAAGYVAVNKSGRGRGSVTSFRITRSGRRAYRAHRQALTTLLGMAESTQD